MKKLILILPVVALGITGCVVHQPSPSAGQYGYTYDYQVPIAEGVPAPTFSRIPEPRRTDRFVSTAVVADTPPAPPTTPPIVSSIPEITPRPIIQNRTTTVIPQQQPAIIREGAGAQSNDGAAQQPGAPGSAPAATALSGVPVLTGSVTNPPSSNPPPNQPPTNQPPTNLPPTNVGPTNGFNPQRPGTNINEGAGAQPTNNVPQRIDPAPRLPAQPSIQPGQTPTPAPSPTTLGGQGTAQQTQPQSGTAPAPAPAQQQPSGNVAPEAGQQNQGAEGTQTPAQP